MPRVAVEYSGDTIELAVGETIVGRAVTCRLRLNDPAVSREHVRFIVGPQFVTVEDLGSTNGTTINGRAISGRQPVVDSDEIRLGDRVLRLLVLDEHSSVDVERTARTTPRTHDDRAPRLPTIRHFSCVRCRSRVTVSRTTCPQCGEPSPRGRPYSPTLDPVMTKAIDRRADARRLVKIPLVYSSAALTFEAAALDLSLGGMFVETDLLEPIGTCCQITVLPDGDAALTLNATVCRAVVDDEHRGAGMGLMFTDLDPRARRWLARILHHFDETAPARSRETAR